VSEEGRKEGFVYIIRKRVMIGVVFFFALTNVERRGRGEAEQ